VTARTLRRRIFVLAAITAMAATAFAVIAFALPRHLAGRTLLSLQPAAAAGWPHLTLPNGTAELFYPPSLHPIAGDTDAITAARLSPRGTTQLYLNATPRQGGEQLRNWAAFRLDRLRSDDAASAHEVAARQHVRFRGGSGSCVIDDYLTRIGRHHYEEIACLVQGRTSATVIVAAAPAAAWARARPLLSRAVAAYLVR
jgi:hypothetical protein